MLDTSGGFTEDGQVLYHMRNRVAAGDLSPAQADRLQVIMDSHYLRNLIANSHFQWYYVDEMDPNGPQSFRVYIDKAIDGVLRKETDLEG